VIGNVGDSRAVLGTRDVDNSLIAVQLTVDLKPNLPGSLSISVSPSHTQKLKSKKGMGKVRLMSNNCLGLMQCLCNV